MINKKVKRKFCLYGIYSKSMIERELKYLRACGFECYTEKVDDEFTKIFMK